MPQIVAAASTGCWSKACGGRRARRSPWCRPAGNGRRGCLLLHQPAQGSSGPLQIGRIPDGVSGQDQGLRQARIVVGEPLLEPDPVPCFDRVNSAIKRSASRRRKSAARVSSVRRRNNHQGPARRRPRHAAREIAPRSSSLRQTASRPRPARQIDVARAQTPRAHRVRPWLSSEPVSSSQRRLKPMKFRNRLMSGFQACWTKAANRAVNISDNRCSPGLLSAHASRSARALSSTQ